MTISSSHIDEILDQESKLLADLTINLLERVFNKYTKNNNETNMQIICMKKESAEKCLEYEERWKSAIDDVEISKANIKNMEHEIESLKSELKYSKLSLSHTKTALTVCQNELKSTSTDLEKYFQVSEYDRKNIHSAYLEMREKVVQESIKCNRYESQCSLLKGDKENCEFKLQKNQEKLKKTIQKLQTSKSTFERNIMNKEAQRQQLQYMTLIKESR